MSRTTVKPKTYDRSFKLKVVKLFFEEGYTRKIIQDEFKIPDSTLDTWIRLYKLHGESAFYPKVKKLSVKLKSENPIKEKIIEHKKSNPTHGSKRISQIFKRFLGVKVSTSEVRETLKEQDLIESKPKKQQRNPPKPRFFERSNPNQLWQTDIMCFRLAGQNAYLIGFIDDYSRYIVGLGVYRSQTAENVLETIKISFGEYGIPKELLSDNGRQYHNWRGTTKFEKLLQTHRIKHIRSQPHHPQTCGKIERFWKTIQQEFLFKCQFESFENFRERLNLWMKYYNFKRPHQGIGGMCPADRFFEIQHDLKQTLEKNIAENTQELALRGKVKNPFYMVGRMGDQNVAILAEKGKIVMHLDDEKLPEGRQIEYDLNEEINDNNIIEMELNINETSSNSTGNKCITGSTNTEKISTESEENIHSRGEMSSSFISMVDEPKCEFYLQGERDSACSTGALAGSSFNRDDESIRGETSSSEHSSESTTSTFKQIDEQDNSENVRQGETSRIPTRKTTGNLIYIDNGKDLNITI